MLERDDARDAFISDKYDSIESLPQGAIIGTSSVRRGAILLSLRPDLKIVPLRGNVDTRLAKLAAGQVDATLLAVAGLERMGLLDKITQYLEPETMLPAVCQGVIGLQIKTEDTETAAILDDIHHAPTGLIAAAERALPAVLDGSCRTPIGSFAELIDDNQMRLRGLVSSPDGNNVYASEDTMTVTTIDDAIALGTKVGHAIKNDAPQKYLDVVYA